MIEVLVGVTASGKSAYAARRAAAGALVLSYDALLLMLHGGRYEHAGELDGLYEEVFLAALRAAAAHGRDVVLDGCHLSRASRAYWLRVARTLGVPCAAVVFPTHGVFAHTQRRMAADARGKTLEQWRAVVWRQLERLAAEPVAAAEGFDDIREVRA